MRYFVPAWAVLVLILALTPGAQAQSLDQCKAIATAMKSDIDKVSAKYKATFAAESQSLSERAQKIKDENPDPSPVGATLTFDIKVTSHQQEFIFGLPTATMKTQAMSFDLPVITSSTIKWSWSIPEGTMKQQCIPGIPETVCSVPVCSLPSCNFSGCSGGGCSGGGCSLKAGKDICTNVPDITMVQHSASMDVPSTTMQKQNIKLDLPEFSMAEQHIILTIPDFTLVDVKAATQKMESDSNDLQSAGSQEVAKLSAQMKTDVKQTADKGIKSTFDCYESSIAGQRDAALLNIDNNIAKLRSSADQARSMKNDPVAAQIDAAIQQVSVNRAAVVATFAKVLTDLRAQRDQALAKNVGF
jgi:hypothetical protein